MSYQIKPRYGAVVVCDLCGALSAMFDPDWRQMQSSPMGEPIHLCSHCRPKAIWCQTHQSYHYADAQHRCQCTCCGGLFTTPVRGGNDACPSCRRITPTAHPSADQPSLLALVNKLFR